MSAIFIGPMMRQSSKKEMPMTAMRIFAVAAVLCAAAVFSPLASADPGVAIRAGDVSVGIGDRDRDCRSDDSRRDCRRSENSAPAISIEQNDHRGDRDHHEHDDNHDGDHDHDAH
jgi:hypothetical protein